MPSKLLSKRVHNIGTSLDGECRKLFARLDDQPESMQGVVIHVGDVLETPVVNADGGLRRERLRMVSQVVCGDVSKALFAFIIAPYFLDGS